MDSERQVLSTFYEALKRLDYKTMEECYHPESTFEDPVFGELNHEETAAMWCMLCGRAEHFSLSYSVDTPHSCHWKPSYTFSKTKRHVVNDITSQFEFKEGKIFRQKDAFNLWRWSRQALGTVGWLLGWFGPFQEKIREEARQGLLRFMHKA